MRCAKAVVKSGLDRNKFYDNYSVMNRIMLRFRPIAPKPPGGESLSDAAADRENKNGSVKRTKRKYVRVRCRQSKIRKTSTEQGKPSPPEKSAVDDSPMQPGNRIVTLQLLPERSESEKSYSAEKTKDTSVNQLISPAADVAGASSVMKSVGSGSGTWIIVECVTEKFVDNGLGLGFTDREKINNLDLDTCPGFVSDDTNKVIWINEAYRKMVGEEDGGGGGNNNMVWLVVKNMLPQYCPSFACRVRLIQQTKKGQKWNRIVPCDVWRMEFAGFAWRLDVNTSLGLGI